MSSDDKIGEGRPGPGRPLGAIGRIHRDIKQAILDGAILSDYGRLDPDDENAQPSLSTYCKNFANNHPELFWTAIVKLIPKQILQHMSNDTQIDVSFETMDQVKTAMLESGMTPQQIKMIESMLPVPLVDEDESK